MDLTRLQTLSAEWSQNMERIASTHPNFTQLWSTTIHTKYTTLIKFLNDCNSAVQLIDEHKLRDPEIDTIYFMILYGKILNNVNDESSQ